MAVSDPRDRESLPHDDELGELYRCLPADEPRAELDRAILEAGRRAAARPRGVVRSIRSVRSIRRVRWIAPLAAAAGVVLTLTLTRVADRTAEPVSSDAPAAELRDRGVPAAELDAPAQRDVEVLGHGAGDAPPPGQPQRMDGSPSSHAESRKAAPPAMREESAPRAQDSFAAPPSAAIPRQRASQAGGEALRAESATQPPAGAAAKAEAKRSAQAAAEARPAPPPPAALARDNDTMAPAAPEAASSAASEAPAVPCMDDGSPAAPEPPRPEVCPFLVTVGLTAEEACHALTNHLRRPCRVDGDRIEMRLEPPVALADGAPAERIVVELAGGRVQRMRVFMAGGTERLCPSGSSGTVGYGSGAYAPAHR
jgi:hypothetical protein